MNANNKLLSGSLKNIPSPARGGGLGWGLIMFALGIALGTLMAHSPKTQAIAPAPQPVPALMVSDKPCWKLWDSPWENLSPAEQEKRMECDHIEATERPDMQP